MGISLCRRGREKRLVYLSLISATIPGEAGPQEVEEISDRMSETFGYATTYETKMLDEHRPAKKAELRHMKPWYVRKGRIHGRVWLERSETHPGEAEHGEDDHQSGYENSEEGGGRWRRSLFRESVQPLMDWAFIHREMGDSVKDHFPDQKAVWVFLRNGSDPCIPCSFLCGGCERGRLRLAVSGLSPYKIDSEIISGSMLDGIQSAMDREAEIEYAKKGLVWNGYVPRQLRRFSGDWFYLALMDYFHRNSGVLPDFDYPLSPSEYPVPGPCPDEQVNRSRSRWFPFWMRSTR